MLRAACLLLMALVASVTYGQSYHYEKDIGGELKLVANFWAEINNGKFTLTTGGYVRARKLGKKLAEWNEEIVSVPMERFEAGEKTISSEKFRMRFKWAPNDNKMIRGDVDLYWDESKVADLAKFDIPIKVDNEGERPRPNEGPGAQSSTNFRARQFDVYTEEQQGPKGNSFQRWRLEEQANGTVLIVNAHSNFVLDYHNQRSGQQYDCYIERTRPTNHPPQQWKLEGNDADGWVIKNVANSRVLDFYNEHDANKRQVYLENRVDGAHNQVWDIEKVTVNGENFVLIRARKNERVLDYFNREP